MSKGAKYTLGTCRHVMCQV